MGVTALPLVATLRLQVAKAPRVAVQPVRLASMEIRRQPGRPLAIWPLLGTVILDLASFQHL